MDSKKIFMTEKVIGAINGELEYQNKMAGTDRANEEDNGLSGQIVTLGTYADKARDAWTLSNGNETALHELRKVAAICVRALVRFGCPLRAKKCEIKSEEEKPRKGSLALCGLGCLGVITQDEPKEVVYQDGNKGFAFVGIHLTDKVTKAGEKWSSRHPIVVGHVDEFTGVQ
jgi:hypothetical protein